MDDSSHLTAHELEILGMLDTFEDFVPNEDGKVWLAVIDSRNEPHSIMIFVPNFPLLTDLQIVTSSRVLNMLIFRLRAGPCYGFKDLLHLLPDIVLEAEFSDPLSRWNRRQANFVKLVCEEITQNVGSVNLVEASSDFHEVTLGHFMSTTRTLIISLKLGKDYPAEAPIIKFSDLPKAIENGIAQSSTLGDVYSRFCEEISNLIPLWEELDRFKNEGWVTDPVTPTFKDWYRRVVLSESLSVLVTFDPTNPTAAPELKFLGSIDMVSKTRKIYEENLRTRAWATSSSLSYNLRTLCGVNDLPRKPSATREEEERCIICLSYKSGNESPPSRWCTNLRCASLYHSLCLVEWFKSIAVTKLLYDYISGPCPYCSEAIFIEKKMMEPS